MVVEYEVSEELFPLVLHRFAGIGPATAPPENALHFGVSVQIFGQQFAHISLCELAENFFVRRRNNLVVL